MNLRWVDASASAFGWPAGLDFLTARLQDQFRQPDVPRVRAGRAEHLRARPRAFDRLIARGLSITFRDCGEWGVEHWGAANPA
jgi:hypothetical protein